MKNYPLEIVTAELKRRGNFGTFDIESYCFGKQLDFIKDVSPFKTAVCSRRAGKTVGDASYLIDTAQRHSEGICLYLTLTRANAKRLIWPELLKINRQFNLGAKINEAELSMQMPKGSVIYVSGAKDKSEIEKFRGLAIRLCIIDEAQGFRPYIEALVDDVIAPTLIDYGGTLAVTGTPGPVKVGYYYSCATSKQWSHHYWTLFDNPHLQAKSGQTADELLQRELVRKGVDIDNPTIQREYFGRWVNDPDSLVFKYNSEINNYIRLPEVTHPWNFIIGVDLGFVDADAIAVIGYNEKIKSAFLVEEQINRKQGITELAEQLGLLIKKYDPDRIVMDTGGLGKKIAEECRSRYGLPIIAAEKTRKIEFIEILNDAMRTQRFFAKANSAFAQDCLLVEWDKESSTPEKLSISDAYHSDIIDAVLYAFRESLHWLYQPEVKKPEVGTPEHYKQIENDMENMARQQLKKDDDIWGDYDQW